MQLLRNINLIFLTCTVSWLSAQPGGYYTDALEGRYTAESYWQSAEKLYEEGFYADALSDVLEAIQRQKHYPEAYYLRGMIHEKLREPYRAIDDYDMALKQQPSYHEALFNKSTLLFQLKKYELAKQGFTKLLQMPVRETQSVYFKMADLGSTHQGQASGIMTLSDQQFEYYHYRALCNYQLKEYDLAQADFNKAIQLQANNPDLYVNQGLAWQRAGHLQRAEACFRKALQIDPDHQLAKYNLALLGDKDAGRKQKIAAYDEMVQGEEAFPSAYVNRGVLKMDDGDLRGAIADFDTAISIGLSDAQVYLNRGLAHEKNNDLARAIRDYDMAVKLEPTWHKAYSSRGNAHFKMKAWQLALNDYEMATLRNPQEPRHHYHRGLTLRQLGRNTEACQALKKAMDLGFSQAGKAYQAYCK
jgi:tetratricopeptide (TPR) repeat protein